MDKFREFIELIRSILPKAHNRLASAMVVGGITLMLGPPLVEKLILVIFNKAVDTKLTESDQLYGFGLVIWGSIYHITMTKLSEISDALETSKKYDLRRSLIDECRSYLQENEFNRKEFADTVLYSRLRPHLSEKLIKEIEKDPNHITLNVAARGGGVDNYKPHLLDERVELENKWRLL